jgi:hypothetical protein
MTRIVDVDAAGLVFNAPWPPDAAEGFGNGEP